MTDPVAQLETGTPRLTTAQVADLERRAQTPAALDIEAEVDASNARFARVNELTATETVTVPLLKLPAANPRGPGGAYRVPLVHGVVNGHAGVPLMLDSGSNRDLLGYSLATRLDIPPIAGLQPVTASGIGGAVGNHIAIVPGLQIGSLQFRKLLALIGPDAQAMSYTAGFGWKTPLMIVGVNTFRPLSYLTVDSLRGTATFSPQEPYVPDRSLPVCTVVPLTWREGLPAITVSIDGSPPLPCLLDTGGDYGMLVPRALATKLGYWRPGQGALGTARGVGGAALTTQYNVRQITVGTATFAGVPARTNLIGPEPAAGQLLLGNIVLRRHRVTFDFRSGLLWLER